MYLKIFTDMCYRSLFLHFLSTYAEEALREAHNLTSLGSNIV